MGFTNVLAGGAPRTTAAGRTYSNTTIAVDRGNLDTSELFHTGWVTLADHTGPSAGRPLVDEYNHPIALGFRYLDTTLGKIVVRAGTGWIDATNGATT